MKPLRKKIYAAAGYNTVFFGSGRKEFHPKKPMRSFEEYIKEAGDAVAKHCPMEVFDEGVISNFMAPRYIKQANLPGFLPYAMPSLEGKPCTATEAACGSGGRGIASACRSILSDQADAVFLLGFEIQNSMKAVYGADVLAGAAYYNGERKNGYAHFFPGIFAQRTGAYYEKFGKEKTRQAMARWYELSILAARKNPKAQEYHNKTEDLYALGLSEASEAHFVPHLNLYDCSKVSDGASAVGIYSEEGLVKAGIDPSEAVEIVAVGESIRDITKAPPHPTRLHNTARAAQNAFSQCNLKTSDLSVLELHDCFSITGLLSLEAIGFAEEGKGADFILDGNTSLTGKIPTNLSGGLGGFGHPVGASGVRQLVDLLQQFTGKADNPVKKKSPYGMLCSMGGNDISVTSVIVKATSF